MGLERITNLLEPPDLARRYVLDEDDGRSKLSDESQLLELEDAARVREAEPLASAGDPLAGEASAQHIDRDQIARRELRHVAVARNAGKVLLEHPAAERVDLGVPDDVTEARPGQGEPRLLVPCPRTMHL